MRRPPGPCRGAVRPRTLALAARVHTRGMRRRLLILAILTACDGGSAGPIDASPDARDDAPATLTCEEIGAALQARAAVTSRQCATPSDCGLYGYPADSSGGPTCNCGATWSSTCGGDPVNIAAWTGDATAAALSAEWAARCIGGTNGLCDCTRGTASCVEGTCRGTTYDCFNPPDAGVR